MAGEGHEYHPTQETDDYRHHEPVFEMIVPLFAFLYVADKGQEEENRGDELLGPVKNEFGIVSAGKQREGKEDETHHGQDGGQPINRVLADPACLSEGLLSPPRQIAQIQKYGEKHAGGDPAPRDERRRGRREIVVKNEEVTIA